MGYTIFKILALLLDVYSYVIIADVIVSWILPPQNQIRQFLDFITEPVVAPIRKLIQPWTSKSMIPLDLSPLLAILAINIVRAIVVRLMFL